MRKKLWFSEYFNVAWGKAHLTVKRWTDELSEQLINAISEDADIKQGLFPAPGGNVSSSKGGGKKKTAWYWKLAEILFFDHDIYSTAFEKAASDKSKDKAKSQAIWGDKIKNRLSK